MKRPELYMQAPDPTVRGTRRNLVEDLAEAPTIRLYWPVPLLPASMGYLPTAEKLPGESTGAYFLDVEVTFYSDGLAIGGVEPDPRNGSHPYEQLTYEELAYIITEADTAVRGQGDPPPAMTVYQHVEAPSAYGMHPTRRLAGWLRVIDDPDADRALAGDEDDLPF